MKLRSIDKVATAHTQLEGGGFPVRRPFPTHGLDMVDPFLMLDEMGPVDWPPGGAIGAPSHPHRGFETVTYLLAGEIEHQDNHGGGGVIRPGGVQWMTAGRGVVHSEMPTAELLRDGGLTHGFQIWVNLPKAKKLTEPRYQGLDADQIPTATSADGLATVAVIAGEALGVRAAIDTHTPITYQHWTLRAGATVDQPIPDGHNAFAYVFSGSAWLGDPAQELVSGQVAFFGPGDAVRLTGPKSGEAQLLLLSGKPLREPVARYGPFVMNYRHELVQAYEDYQAGRF